MRPFSDATKVSERGNDADGAVAAHPEIPDVVEEDDASRRHRIDWWNEQRANVDVGAARLIDDCGAILIEVAAESIAAIGERTAAEVGSAVDDDSCGLALGV